MTEQPETITKDEDDHQERRQLLADYGFPLVFRLDDNLWYPAWAATFEQILIDDSWHELNGDGRRTRIDLVRPIMEAAPDIQLGEALEHLNREQ